MSEFTRTIKSSATITLDGYASIPIAVTYEYSDDAAPSVINFNFTDTSGIFVGGAFSDKKISSYNVCNGLVDNQILTALQTKLLEVYTNYKTI